MIPYQDSLTELHCSEFPDSSFTSMGGADRRKKAQAAKAKRQAHAAVKAGAVEQKLDEKDGGDNTDAAAKVCTKISQKCPSKYG